MEKLELFAKGCLGTCWYGKYHYMEPWAGCGHDCPYCYARLRSPVTDALTALKTDFPRPRPLYPEEELLRKIAETANTGEISILKLCRYTDIFTPEFVQNGLALKVLKTLVASKVGRIIITTKGLPDKTIINLITSNPKKFSYSAAVRPVNAVVFEKELAPLRARLEAAAEINKAGVLTTVHLDPFVAGFDDAEEPLGRLLGTLKELGLNRAMFSYLLLCENMLGSISRVLTPELTAAIKANYDLATDRQYLPKQEETVYWSVKPEIKRASVEKTAAMLGKLGFEFVLCGLKNIPGLDTTKFKGVTLCNGKFYA
ncbi:MAG: hypothetical protein A2234_07880 [Elusimicrobia bacterium RIFOXYA2_FULL_58_8]|nr:MAG: hypothetical protein A2234_07880 [Elusimicrobia bacterium RIFOXYA2_FULL_58_8]OGS13922.1 MAG: hypothetical protein A2285_10190 [Elusimicrobia bacterium RIFOXYA12_FULL_57_11]